MSREHKKFERLFLFSEVAKQLSFTEAAATLGISRGYLSEQIRQLEKEMGRALLIRTTRSVRLTAQGEMILASMSQVKADLLMLGKQIRHDNEDIVGRIRITAPSQFTQRYLLDICHEFTVRHPQVHFSIDCSYTLFDLAKNDFDLAFRATQNPPQNMVAKKLFDYQQVCCAAPEYLKKAGIPNKIDDLHQHQCLTSAEQSQWCFSNKNIAINSFMSVNDNHMLKTQALLGRGIILGPHYLVDKELQQGTLQAILTHETMSQSATYIVHPQIINQSARLSSFIKFTLEWFGTA
ncbi:LysR family transcriptional regulator [Shewanella inventionis]|uniref:LysR family transcriptional regulator n=1 Tax=Shewanella inventionis TaxID=1738770 RepID=A0ABQ1J0H7_9GAMM|nr:LysR family transcriptional regulator [Shewanella inventionis]MCL1157061.1 LysR family transcriptional regulator [Shewanella inventionis]UAL44511.1 LysR family transcriptional regulator [Shewanella inventionis]GGB54934.1 LysR family transcriptional regulator [Shewanella inventionis]